MIARHPFFDPGSAFSGLWRSIPPDRRVRDYFRMVAREGERGRGPIVAPGRRDIIRIDRHKIDQSGARQTGAEFEGVAAEGPPARLHLSLGEGVRELRSRFADIYIPFGGKNDPPSVRVELIFEDRAARPAAGTLCRLLWVDRAGFDDFRSGFPDLDPGRAKGDARLIVDMLEPATLGRYQVSSFVSALPSVDAVSSDEGSVVYDIPTGGEGLEFDRGMLRRRFQSAHLIVLSEAAKNASEVSS